jgi:hypothetical protein
MNFCHFRHSAGLCLIRFYPIGLDEGVIEVPAAPDPGFAGMDFSVYS